MRGHGCLDCKQLPLPLLYSSGLPNAACNIVYIVDICVDFRYSSVADMYCCWGGFHCLSKSARQVSNKSVTSDKV